MNTIQQIFHMNWFDLLLVTIIAISALISLARGFIKEMISLATWIIGIWVAFKYSSNVTSLIDSYVNLSSLPAGVRTLISFAVVFMLVLIGGAIFNFLISMLLVKTGLSGTDRLVGVLFGLARGVLLTSVIILLLSTTAFAQDDWYRSSTLIPHMQGIVDWLRGILPQKITDVSSLLPR